MFACPGNEAIEKKQLKIELTNTGNRILYITDLKLTGSNPQDDYILSKTVEQNHSPKIPLVPFDNYTFIITDGMYNLEKVREIVITDATGKTYGTKTRNNPAKWKVKYC